MGYAKDCWRFFPSVAMGVQICALQEFMEISFVRATIWKIWLEMKTRVFRNVSKPVEVVIESIVCTVSERVSKQESLKGYLEDLNRSWAASLNVGWQPKALRNSSSDESYY